MTPPFDLPAALEAVRHQRRVLICPHDDPDPDALAAAWGMAVLLQHELGAEVTIGFEGIIGRAENRAMVRELGIKLRRLEKLDPADFDGVALVDSQPAARNHSVPPALPMIACVDHHRQIRAEPQVPWFDVRPNEETSSTIVLGYLREREIEPGEQLCTAILYALKTDTRDFTREAGAQDLAAYEYVSERADMTALGAIVNPQLDNRYYRMLHQMLDGTNLHGKAAEVFLGELPYPDLVAEMADLLVRRKGTDWCICGGQYGQALRFSVRTEATDASAGEVAVVLADRFQGSAGGHGMTAGGRFPLARADDPAGLANLWGALVRAFLTELDAPFESEPLCPHPETAPSGPLPSLTD